MSKEIKITQDQVDLAIGKLSQPDIFFPKAHPAECELGRLIALRLEKTTIEYPVDLMQIVVDILKQVNKEKLQSRMEVPLPLWKLSGKTLVLDLLPKLSPIFKEIFPEEFADEIISMISDATKSSKYRLN